MKSLITFVLFLAAVQVAQAHSCKIQPNYSPKGAWALVMDSGDTLDVSRENSVEVLRSTHYDSSQALQLELQRLAALKEADSFCSEPAEIESCTLKENITKQGEEQDYALSLKMGATEIYSWAGPLRVADLSGDDAVSLLELYSQNMSTAIQYRNLLLNLQICK